VPAAGDGAAVTHGFYACVICVKKKNLYPSVKAIQKVRHGVSASSHRYSPVVESLIWMAISNNEMP
jgi:hypothetical protein